MKHLHLILFLLAIAFYSCDPTPHDEDNDQSLTTEEGRPVYKDHEIDSMTIKVDESTKLLDQEIRVAQDDVDSLLEGL